MRKATDRRSLAKYKRSTIVGELLPNNFSNGREKLYFHYIIWNLNNFHISLLHRLVTVVLTFISVICTFKQHGFSTLNYYTYWTEILILLVSTFLFTANFVTIITCRQKRKIEFKTRSYRVLESIYKAVLLTVLGGGVSITLIYLFILKDLYSNFNKEPYQFFKEFMAHSIIPAMLFIDFLFQQIVIPVKYIFWTILLNSIYLLYNFCSFIVLDKEIYVFWTNYANGLYAGWYIVFNMLMNATLFSGMFCYSTHKKNLNN